MKASKKDAALISYNTQDFISKLLVLGFGFATLIFIAKKLFEDEFSLVINWWLILLASGLAFLPLTMLVLRRFKDSGWLFSKVIGVAVSGWFMWLLASVKIMKFGSLQCWISVGICFALNVVLYLLYIHKRRNTEDFVLFENPQETVTHMALTELLFLLAFIIWNYIKAFRPEAYGTTEKMMDYGFMKAMFKSDYMPPEDMWLAGQPINYYYVGQFLATYLTKLAGTGVEYGYNFSLNMLAAFGFALPCSIVFNASWNFKSDKEKLKDRVFPYVAAGISGLAVSIAGNMHYCIFNNLAPILRSIIGVQGLADKADYTFSGYWFPNATRYIGYNPETNDKTIHEFPSYSFVLGDLHAHVLNIMFVLTVIAILLGLILQRKKELEGAMQKGLYLEDRSKKGVAGFSLKEIFQPQIILCGFFTGLFHTTNFWDYPIYFVVSGAIILFVNCRLYNFSKRTLLLTLFHAVIVIVTGDLMSLPFTLNFNQIASQLNICETHTPLYQLLILWGLPVIVTLVFLGALIKEKKEIVCNPARTNEEPGRKNVLFRFIANLNLSDMFILTLGLCAIGLVLLPEIVYVKDIYSGDYKRANTMFKLSYQAFIMFGMVMGYSLTKFVFYSKKGLRVFGIIALYFLISTFGYFDNATKAWFGDYNFVTEDGAIAKDLDFVLTIAYYVLFGILAVSIFYLFEAKRKKYKQLIAFSLLGMFAMSVVIILFGSYFVKNDRYKHLNSGVYLENENYDDFLATNWINENIEGRPVLLEANGNSYTYFERISTITGLPTILGWRTHEWLWQSTSEEGGLPDIVAEREEDIEDIYTSDDYGYVMELLRKYNVEYIYVGGCEREKFNGDDKPEINIPMLLQTGSVCYPEDFDASDTSGTFIIKVGR